MFAFSPEINLAELLAWLYILDNVCVLVHQFMCLSNTMPWDLVWISMFPRQWKWLFEYFLWQQLSLTNIFAFWRLMVKFLYNFTEIEYVIEGFHFGWPDVYPTLKNPENESFQCRHLFQTRPLPQNWKSYNLNLIEKLQTKTLLVYLKCKCHNCEISGFQTNNWSFLAQSPSPRTLVPLKPLWQ